MHVKCASTEGQTEQGGEGRKEPAETLPLPVSGSLSGLNTPLKGRGGRGGGDERGRHKSELPARSPRGSADTRRPTAVGEERRALPVLAEGAPHGLRGRQQRARGKGGQFVTARDALIHRTW